MPRKALLWAAPAGNTIPHGSDRHSSRQLGQSHPGYLRVGVEGWEEESGGRRGVYPQLPNHRCTCRGGLSGRSRRGGGAVAGAGIATWILFGLVVLSKCGILMCVCIALGEKTCMLLLSQSWCCQADSALHASSCTDHLQVGDNVSACAEYQAFLAL